MRRFLDLLNGPTSSTPPTNDTPPVPEQTPVDSSSRLEDTLLVLAGMGRPSLRRLSKGWYCGIELPAASVGVELEIRSEYDHPTPLDAARECLIRVNKAKHALAAGAV